MRPLRTHPPARPLAYLWAACLIALLALAACSDPPASPTPVVTAGEVLNRSATAMAGVTSFQFRLESQGGRTPIPAGLELSSAEGAMEKPDRVRVQVNAQFSGFAVEVGVVSIGDQTYMTNPLTGRWERFEAGLSPVAFFDPAKGVGLVLESMMDPRLEGVETVEGVEAHHVRGQLPAGAVEFIAGSSVEGSVLDADLWIGTQDHLLRRVRLEGVITEGEPPGLVRVLTLRDFNAPADIRAPV